MPGASGEAIKAGEAFVELNADDKQFKKILDKNAERFRRFAHGLRNVSLGAIAIGVGILTPMIGATVASLRLLDTINDISERTNSSAESVSRLAYAAKLSATSIEEVEAANKHLTKAAIDAKNESIEQAVAFNQMGISAKDFLELPIDEKFVLVAKGLEGINNQTDKARYLTALLGENAASLIPLLSGGEKGLRNMFAEAHDVGAVVNTEDAKKAAMTMDKFDKVLTSVKSTIIEVGLAVLTLGDNTGESLATMMMYLKMARDWIKENRKLVAIIAIVGATLVAVGVAGVALSFIIGGLVIAVKAFVAVVGIVLLVLSPIGLKIALIVVAAVALAYIIYRVVSAFVKFTALGAKLGEIFTRNFAEIGKTFGVMWEGILGALKKGDFELLWQIILVGVRVLFLQFKMFMQETWNAITNYIVNIFVDAVAIVKIAFLQAFLSVKLFILKILDMIIKKTQEIAMATVAVAKATGVDISGILPPLQKIQLKIEKEIETTEEEKINVKRTVSEEVEHFKGERERKQHAELEVELKEIDKARAALEKLKNKANEKPAEIPVVQPDMAVRKVGMKLQERIDLLGDSAKGLFSSADYQSSLALGEANTFAKRQLEVNKDLLGEIKALRKDEADINRNIVDNLAAINAKVGFGQFN